LVAGDRWAELATTGSFARRTAMGRDVGRHPWFSMVEPAIAPQSYGCLTHI
jgi:hypothetical protein